MITFLRRKALGTGSVRGMTAFLEGVANPKNISVINHKGYNTRVYRNDKPQPEKMDGDYLIRWGCTSPSNTPLERQLNVSAGIHAVSDKKGFRAKLMASAPHTIPATWFVRDDVQYPAIIRPKHHAQGKNLYVVANRGELDAILDNYQCLQNGWYASEVVDKKAEYRVYVVQGRVATVAEKIPDDPNQMAWNVAQGGEFKVVNWDGWNKLLPAIDICIQAYNESGLDFSGVDVMISKEGKPYVIELNSAPSLPLLTDGSVSYRQMCMAKCFKYISENGKEKIPYSLKDKYRGVIHPAVCNKASMLGG